MRATFVAIAVLTASAPVLADESPVPESLVRVRSRLRERAGNVIAGGTVTVAPASGEGVQTTITGEDGTYTFDLPPGPYTIVAYYLDQTIERRDVLTDRERGTTVVLRDTVMNPSNTTCILLLVHEPGAEGTARPYFGLTVPRHVAPLSRDRTHRAWIAPLPAADARTAVTTVEHGVRFYGAPGIPTVFLEDVTTSTSRVPFARATGSGGSTEVVLRSGTNEHHAEMRSVLALDHTWERTDTGFAQESFLGGPIVHNAAWYGLGLVVDEGGRTHGMARINYAKSPEQQGEVIGLTQDTGTARDDWAKAGWVSKLNNNRIEFRATVTGEQLALVPESVAHGETPNPVAPVLVNRIGGALDLGGRIKLLGVHTFALHASAGTGAIDDERHREVSLAAGDSWEVRPNITLEAGVRSDTRRVGGAETNVVSPRAALVYDPTREMRSEVFVAAQRVPHIDDGLIGAWRGEPTSFHDEVSAGASYQPPNNDWIMGGAAIRSTGDRTGVDGWLRLDHGGSVVHATASTLYSAGALYAQYRFRKKCGTCRKNANGFTALAALRTHEVAGSPLRINESALGLAWRRPGKGVQPNAAIELHDGTLGTGARVILGGAW